ncbi:MAG TPA: flagellar export protein FliJ [Caldimonas sp.]
MTNLQPLIALLAQTERQRDLALADQMKAQAASQAAQAQAENLLAYRRDYEQRWSAQFCREGRIELVRCYQGFMERLTQAVDAQVRTARLASAQLERATTTVREHEIQVAAVSKLVERRLAEGRREAHRHEQKENDELAARIAWTRISAARQANPA